MKPVLVNGQLWRFAVVPGDSPLLVDRTGELKVAVTDPRTRFIYISRELKPPLLDKVVLHEVAHAITVSHGLLGPLRNSISDDMWIHVEEWSASLMERHAIEAAILASQALDRPLCIGGYCIMS